VDRDNHALRDARLFFELEIFFPQKFEETKIRMDEDDDFPESDHTNPANDKLAHISRWIGLICGIAILGWTAFLLS
jgi:hypothetical protein